MKSGVISNVKIAGKGNGEIYVVDGLIALQKPLDAVVFDAQGGLVLPGMVDLHGDGFERVLQPRAGVMFDLDDALQEADNQLISNGITTGFHAFTVSWETGLRSLDFAERIFCALKHHKFRAQTYPHIRWETFALDAQETVSAWLAEDMPMLLSLNDHTTANLNLSLPSSKIDRIAARLGATPEEVIEMLATHAARQDEVPHAVRAMCRMAVQNNVPLLAHDERSADDRRLHRSHGVKICEFPITDETVQDAKSAGEPIILGAPNIVRGGSHTGAIDARLALADGTCSVLVSDYYYPSMLQAMIKLADGDPDRLAEHWPLVSRNPALAAGLPDRGAIAPGLRADLLVFWPNSADLRAVFVNGRKVLEFG